MSDLMPAIEQHTDSLLATAGTLRDLDHDSFCVGWTRAHILAHLASNGRGMVNLVRAVVDGEPLTMYASQEARDADIAAGATKPPATLLHELETTCEEATAALRRLGPEHADVHAERVPGGPSFRAAVFPYMRLREVIYHHVDLDAGFTFLDVEPELLGMFLDREVTQLARRPGVPAVRLISDEGDSYDVGDEPETTVTGSRAGLVLWLSRQMTVGVSGEPSLPELPRGA